MFGHQISFHNLLKVLIQTCHSDKMQREMLLQKKPTEILEFFFILSQLLALLVGVASISKLPPDPHTVLSNR
jgi:hypothetical protein